MFTGIVDHTGKIRSIGEKGKGLVIEVETNFEEVKPGESVAVDGVCLTSIKQDGKSLFFEVSSETWERSIVGNYQPGTLVNLELPLRLSDRLGGHFVMGHVDTRGKITSKRTEGEYVGFEVTGISPEHAKYLVPKGSVSINGVSLTVNECSGDFFRVFLIPHTLTRTNLNLLGEGSLVNLEFDWLMKIVAKEVRSLAAIVIEEKR